MDARKHGISARRALCSSTGMRRFVSAVVLASLAPVLAPRVAHADPPAPESETVLVHIDSPQAVDLEMQGAGGFRHACTSPCDKELPARAAYRIAGQGVRPSSQFGLAPGDGRVTLTVSPAGSMAPAITTLALGGVAFVGGLLSVGIGALLNVPSGKWPWNTCEEEGNTPQEVAACIAGGQRARHEGDPWMVGGGIAAAAGAVVLAVGLFGLLNSSTTVEQPAADVPTRTAEWKGPGWSPPTAHTTSLVTIRF